MGAGSCWRRAWGLHFRGDKRERIVWRNSRALWEGLKPVEPCPTLGMGKQSAAVTSPCTPHLYYMERIFDKFSYPWEKKNGKVSFPLPTVSVFFFRQIKLQALMTLVLCCCCFWQKWDHELTKNRNAAYFLSSQAQDEQNTLGKQKKINS